MDNGKVLKSTFRFPLGAACAAIKRRWRDDFAAQAAPKVGIGLKHPVSRGCQTEWYKSRLLI
jgi:hypothetical protein